MNDVRDWVEKNESCGKTMILCISGVGGGGGGGGLIEGECLINEIQHFIVNWNGTCFQ